nr:hypothetical protein [Tanacetum cinerariifolium]
DESMDDGDDVNDKLSFGAKEHRVDVELYHVELPKCYGWCMERVLINPMFNEVSSSESKVLGQNGFPAYVSAGSGSDGPIRRIHGNGYGVLKV